MPSLRDQAYLEGFPPSGRIKGVYALRLRRKVAQIDPGGGKQQQNHERRARRMLVMHLTQLLFRSLKAKIQMILKLCCFVLFMVIFCKMLIPPVFWGEGALLE